MNKQVCIIVDCKPSGDSYTQVVKLKSQDEINESAEIQLALTSVLWKAIADHDRFESYQIKVNPLWEDGQ